MDKSGLEELKIMEKTKYAVLIYPEFSLQEITCITSCLTVWFGEKIDIIASEKKAYTSEDGFSVIPNKTVDEAEPSDYVCLILPGKRHEYSICRHFICAVVDFKSRIAGR